jgi:hypothetical protein
VIPSELLGLRWDASAKRHVESWFFKANEPDGRRALWIRFTIFDAAPLAPVADAWAVAFDRHRGHVAVKSTIALAAARFARDAIDVEVDGSRLTEDHARGTLSSGRGKLAWDLTIGPSRAAPILHYPSLAMYRSDLPPSSKLVTPVSDARASGTVRVDRGGGDVDTWEIDAWRAMIGHNWGRRNAELYAWTHCNAWSVDDLVFEAVSARVRVGPVLSPMATSAYVRWRGKSYDLSRLRALANNRGVISLRRWEMRGSDRGVEVVCDVAAETDDIVGLHYANPVGPMTHCLNTKLARARIEARFPNGETVSATSRAAALEIGTLDPGHGVRMYL